MIIMSFQKKNFLNDGRLMVDLSPSFPSTRTLLSPFIQV